MTGGDQNGRSKVSSSWRRAKVAVVQASPVVFDRERTLDKVRALAGEAARKGAQLVLFPEAFVSAYPRGLDFGAVVGGAAMRVGRSSCAIGKAASMCPGRRWNTLERRRVSTASIW
jgi:hypothetical protein